VAVTVPPPLVALGIIALVVAIVVVLVKSLMGVAARRSAARRAAVLAGPAAMLGLMPVDALPADLPPFELLNTGTSRRATQVHRGVVGGVDVVLFDYAYFDRRGTTFRTLHYYQDLAGTTIACARASWLNLPAFVMEPSMLAFVKEAEHEVSEQLGEGRMASMALKLMSIAEGMAAAQGGQDFPGRADVRYRVRGLDASAIASLFTPPLLDYFRDHAGWIVEGRGDWLLVTFPWKLRQPVQYTRRSTGQPADEGRLAADQLDALVRAATDTLERFRGAAR
jgi:hypothetical protein